MGTRKLVGAVMAAVLASILVLGFGGSYSLDCGPLDRRGCEDRAREIVAIVSRQFAHSGVSSIVIVDITGHATVLLRDGMRLDVVGGQATEQMI